MWSETSAKKAQFTTFNTFINQWKLKVVDLNSSNNVKTKYYTILSAGVFINA